MNPTIKPKQEITIHRTAQATTTIPFETIRNDTIKFQERRREVIRSGRRFEIELGDCNASEFAWFATEGEARVGHATLESAWREYAESAGAGDGYIEHNAIREILVDGDGDEVGENAIK